MKIRNPLTALHEHKCLVPIEALVTKIAAFRAVEIGTKHNGIGISVLKKAFRAPPAALGTPKHRAQSKLFLPRAHWFPSSIHSLRDIHRNWNTGIDPNLHTH